MYTIGIWVWGSEARQTIAAHWSEYVCSGIQIEGTVFSYQDDIHHVLYWLIRKLLVRLLLKNSLLGLRITKILFKMYDFLQFELSNSYLLTKNIRFSRRWPVPIRSSIAFSLINSVCSSLTTTLPIAFLLFLWWGFEIRGKEKSVSTFIN